MAKAKPRGGDASSPTDREPGTTPSGAAELEQLAADWIALWQSEVAALAADPTVAGFWRQALAGPMAAWAAPAAGTAAANWAALAAATWAPPGSAAGAAPWATAWGSPGSPPWPTPGGVSPAATGSRPAHDATGEPATGASAAAAAPVADRDARLGGADGGARPATGRPGSADETGHDSAVAELRARCAELERRLADLAGGATGSGADRPRPRRRKPPA